MWLCSIDPRTRKYVQGYEFLSFARKYKKKLLYTGIGFLKAVSKNVVHKTVEFLGNKITVTKENNDKIVKSDENWTNFEEIINPLEKEMKY